MSDKDLIDQAAADSAASTGDLITDHDGAVGQIDTPNAPPDSVPRQKSPKTPKSSVAPHVAGLVLVDVPAHGLKCGEHVTLPADIAKALEAHGEFDPKAASLE